MAYAYPFIGFARRDFSEDELDQHDFLKSQISNLKSRPTYACTGLGSDLVDLNCLPPATTCYCRHAPSSRHNRILQILLLLLKFLILCTLSSTTSFDILARLLQQSFSSYSQSTVKPSCLSASCSSRFTPVQSSRQQWFSSPRSVLPTFLASYNAALIQD